MVRQDISTNIIANMLGLGWAATPAAIRAMQGLSRLNHNAKVASNEMCTFLVINISYIKVLNGIYIPFIQWCIFKS